MRGADFIPRLTPRALTGRLKPAADVWPVIRRWVSGLDNQAAVAPPGPKNTTSAAATGSSIRLLSPQVNRWYADSRLHKAASVVRSHVRVEDNRNECY